VYSALTESLNAFWCRQEPQMFMPEGETVNS